MIRSNTVVQKLGTIVRSQYFIPLMLLAIGIIFLPLKGVGPSADSFWYMEKAMGMYKSLNWDTLVIRRPVFPLLMTAFFYIVGPSIQSGFFIVRIFYVLNLLLCYFVGKVLYNKRTGLIFSLLVFTSFFVNRWSSYLLLDNILPFFMLLFLVLLYISMQKSWYLYFILAGLLLGIALLIKGLTTVMYFPLPLCLLIMKRYRNKRNIQGILLLYASLIILISPWLIKIIFGSESSQLLFGMLFDFKFFSSSNIMPSTNEIAQSGSLWSIVLQQLHYLRTFCIIYVMNKFILWRIFFIGMLYTVYEMIWKRSAVAYMIIVSMLLLVPIMVFGTKGKIRPGQVLLLYFLLYLMTANLLVNISIYIPRVIERARNSIGKSIRLLKIVIITVCISLQVFVGVNYGNERVNFARLITDSKIINFYGFSFWARGFMLDRWANSEVREASEWIMKLISRESNIVCPHSNLSAINYFTDYQYKLSLLHDKSLYADAMEHENMEEFGQLLFLWPQRYRFVGYFEDLLLAQINKKQANYVIIPLEKNYLSSYFDNNPSFLLIKTFSEGKIKIYQVNTMPVATGERVMPKFEEGTYRYIRRLYLKDTFLYTKERRNLENIFRATTDWNKPEIGRFFGLIEDKKEKEFWERYQKVTRNTVYND